VSDLSAPSTVDGSSPVPYRSIVIYRYYEPSSEIARPASRHGYFAAGLSDLILKLRRESIRRDKTKVSEAERAAGKQSTASSASIWSPTRWADGRRAFLQNANMAPRRACPVDKLFTYATPHNGSNIGLLGNVPTGRRSMV